MQNVRIVMSGKFPPRFQRKAWESRQETPEKAVHDTGNESKSMLEIPGSSDAMNMQCLLRKAAGCEQIQPKRDAVCAATNEAIGKNAQVLQNLISIYPGCQT